MDYFYTTQTNSYTHTHTHTGNFLSTGKVCKSPFLSKKNTNLKKDWKPMLKMKTLADR